jgi:hypothetical protein
MLTIGSRLSTALERPGCGPRLVSVARAPWAHDRDRAAELYFYATDVFRTGLTF